MYFMMMSDSRFSNNDKKSRRRNGCDTSDQSGSSGRYQRSPGKREASVKRQRSYSCGDLSSSEDEWEDDDDNDTDDKMKVEPVKQRDHSNPSSSGHLNSDKNLYEDNSRSAVNHGPIGNRRKNWVVGREQSKSFDFIGGQGLWSPLDDRRSEARGEQTSIKRGSFKCKLKLPPMFQMDSGSSSYDSYEAADLVGHLPADYDPIMLQRQQQRQQQQQLQQQQQQQLLIQQQQQHMGMNQYAELIRNQKFQKKSEPDLLRGSSGNLKQDQPRRQLPQYQQISNQSAVNNYQVFNYQQPASSLQLQQSEASYSQQPGFYQQSAASNTQQISYQQLDSANSQQLSYQHLESNSSHFRYQQTEPNGLHQTFPNQQESNTQWPYTAHGQAGNTTAQGWNQSVAAGAHAITKDQNTRNLSDKSSTMYSARQKEENLEYAKYQSTGRSQNDHARTRTKPDSKTLLKVFREGKSHSFDSFDVPRKPADSEMTEYSAESSGGAQLDKRPESISDRRLRMLKKRKSRSLDMYDQQGEGGGGRENLRGRGEQSTPRRAPEERPQAWDDYPEENVEKIYEYNNDEGVNSETFRTAGRVQKPSHPRVASALYDSNVRPSQGKNHQGNNGQFDQVSPLQGAGSQRRKKFAQTKSFSCDVKNQHAEMIAEQRRKKSEPLLQTRRVGARKLPPDPIPARDFINSQRQMMSNQGTTADQVVVRRRQSVTPQVNHQSPSRDRHNSPGSRHPQELQMSGPHASGPYGSGPLSGPNNQSGPYQSGPNPSGSHPTGPQRPFAPRAAGRRKDFSEQRSISYDQQNVCTVVNESSRRPVSTGAIPWSNPNNGSAVHDYINEEEITQFNITTGRRISNDEVFQDGSRCGSQNNEYKAEMTHRSAVNVSRDTEMTHRSAVNVSRDTEMTHRSAVNVSRDTEMTHRSAVNVSRDRRKAYAEQKSFSCDVVGSHVPRHSSMERRAGLGAPNTARASSSSPRGSTNHVTHTECNTSYSRVRNVVDVQGKVGNFEKEYGGRFEYKQGMDRQYRQKGAYSTNAFGSGENIQRCRDRHQNQFLGAQEQTQPSLHREPIYENVQPMVDTERSNRANRKASKTTPNPRESSPRNNNTSATIKLDYVHVERDTSTTDKVFIAGDINDFNHQMTKPTQQNGFQQNDTGRNNAYNIWQEQLKSNDKSYEEKYENFPSDNENYGNNRNKGFNVDLAALQNYSKDDAYPEIIKDRSPSRSPLRRQFTEHFDLLKNAKQAQKANFFLPFQFCFPESEEGRVVSDGVVMWKRKFQPTNNVIARTAAEWQEWHKNSGVAIGEEDSNQGKVKSGERRASKQESKVIVDKRQQFAHQKSFSYDIATATEVLTGLQENRAVMENDGTSMRKVETNQNTVKEKRVTRLSSRKSYSLDEYVEISQETVATTEWLKYQIHGVKPRENTEAGKRFAEYIQQTGENIKIDSECGTGYVNQADCTMQNAQDQQGLDNMKRHRRLNPDRRSTMSRGYTVDETESRKAYYARNEIAESNRNLQNIPENHCNMPGNIIENNQIDDGKLNEQIENTDVLKGALKAQSGLGVAGNPKLLKLHKMKTIQESADFHGSNSSLVSNQTGKTPVLQNTERPTGKWPVARILQKLRLEKAQRLLMK